MPPVALSGRANTFFALTPPAPVRREIARLQAQVTPRLPASVRPVPPPNYHITVAFLGAVEASAVPNLCSLAGTVPPPVDDLVLDRLGRFSRARVGWLGSTQVPGPLAAFQARLAGALRDNGYAVDERPWVPHLTLYRNLRTPLPKLDVEPLGWRVDSYELLRTASGQTGPVYRSRGRWTARKQGGPSVLV